jgi:hypothetical protein
MTPRRCRAGLGLVMAATLCVAAVDLHTELRLGSPLAAHAPMFAAGCATAQGAHVETSGPEIAHRPSAVTFQSAFLRRSSFLPSLSSLPSAAPVVTAAPKSTGREARLLSPELTRTQVAGWTVRRQRRNRPFVKRARTSWRRRAARRGGIR